MLLIIESFDHRNDLKVEKKVYYFENKHNFPPPQKCLGALRDKHTKKLESDNYANTLPWKVIIASQWH